MTGLQGLSVNTQSSGGDRSWVNTNVPSASQPSNSAIKANKPTYDQRDKHPENLPNKNIHENFIPEKNHDNMMAENDPIKRLPHDWQKEGNKDEF